MLWTLLLTSLIMTAVCGQEMSRQSFVSDRAIDGDISTCAHSEVGSNQFWTVDLKNVYNISCVCIYNVDCLTTGIDLTKALVIIGNQCITIDSIKTEQNNCLHLREGELARRITVETQSQHLILCEVTIYGKESPFVLITKNMTWEHALYHCRHHHMDLASILNEQDQAWAVAEAREANTDHVWLGLRYTCTLGFWFWIQSYKLEYHNFEDTQKKEECDMSVAMGKADGKWYTKSDNQAYNFICTKKYK